MRLILLILALIFFLSPRAQTHLPVSGLNFTQWQPFPGYNSLSDPSNLNQKWYLSKYGAISAGSVFFNGASITFLAAPAGLQLNRQLNNNLYAFAGISAAPVFFSRSFTDPFLNPSYPGYNLSNPYGFGLNSRVDLGLMYINDAKTFSISGSIGVERSSYPVYPVYPTNRNIKKQ